VLDVCEQGSSEPFLTATFVVDESSSDGRLSVFKVWVKEEHARDFEHVNLANLFLRFVTVHGRKVPTQKDVFKAYRKVFDNALKHKYGNVKSIEINREKTMTTAPRTGLVEITLDYMEKFVMEETKEYIKNISNPKKESVQEA